MKQLVYATTNSGKFQEVKKFLVARGIMIHSPSEFGVEIDVEESGNTLEENATLKAEVFRNALPDECIVIGDDTGVEIDALGGEPGIRVRRWIGETMTDQEIIDYCIKRMENVPSRARFAQFRTVIAVATKGTSTRTFDGILPGHIVETPTPLKIKGFPFESLFYADEYEMMLGEIHQLPTQQRTDNQELITNNILTHRERAITQALSHLRKVI
jgi:XTP/dITP diphosphohydrolase